MNKQLIKGISAVKKSKYREKILAMLYVASYMTPSEISTSSGIRLNHVSNFLRDLRDCGLIACLNDKDKRGRLYQITELGKRVVEENEKDKGC